MWTFTYGSVPYPVAGYAVVPNAYARSVFTPRAYAALARAVAGIRAPSYGAATAAATKRLARLPLTVPRRLLPASSPEYARRGRVRLPARYASTYVTAVPYVRPSGSLAARAPNVTRYALR